MPAGWSPITGYAPDVAGVFLRAFPYATVSLPAPLFRAVAIGLVLGMWAVYAGVLLGFRRVSDAGERRRALTVVTGICVAAHLALVLVPPIFSTDLFRYGLFGRMVTVHGLNPYATPADALAADPLWPYAGWRHLRSHYGASFIWVAAGTSALGGGGPVGTALAFKAVTALFNLVACWAVLRLARETTGGDGLDAFALYALNPLILAESAGGAHPDAIMIAFALLGVLLWWRGRPLAGMALLVVSAGVKYMTGLVGLLLAVHTVFAAPPGRRLRVGAQLAAVAAAVLLALYGPFLKGAAVFGTAAEVILRGRSLEVSRWASPPDTPWVALALFAVFLVVALVMVARGRRTLVLELSAALITFFIVFALRWRMPWYFLTGVALTAVAERTRGNRAVGAVALLLAMLSMLLYCALVPLPSR